MNRNELKNAEHWFFKVIFAKEPEGADPELSFPEDKFPDEDADDAIIVYWLERAADLRDSEARYVLGHCWSEGFVVEGHKMIAHSLFMLAAIHGHAKAQYETGNRLARGVGFAMNCAWALKWYKRAAEKGHKDARLAIEWKFAKINGIEQKRFATARLYRDNARQGDAVVQNNLAGCHLLGLGVMPDFAEAAEWCRKAADQQLAVAQTNLGFCYLYGHGVQQSLNAAMLWFQKGAEGGDRRAQLGIKRVAAHIKM